MLDRDALKAVVGRIDGYRDEVVHVQAELCKRPALGPESDGDGEREKADWLRGYIEKLGYGVEEYNAPDERVSCGHRPNLATVIDGEVDSPKLWIMTHTDVVPPGDPGLWSGDPWTLRVEGDKLIGRGVEDNQGGLVSSLLMAKAFKDAGVKPYLPVGLVFVADEETGSKYGLQYMLENHGDLFDKRDLIIVPDAGDPKGMGLEVAEKSILWIRFRTVGRQTHGSEPEKGINAHKASAWLTTRLDTLYHHFRKQDKLFEPPMSTFEPTKKEANVPNVNTIPGEDVIYFDCRVLPQYKLGDVVRKVKQLVRETEKKFKVKIEFDFPQYEPAAPPTAADAPVARAITRAVKQLRRRTPKPLGIGGGTVAKFFRQAGYPCVVWCTMDDRAHTPDEYMRINHVLEDARVFAHVALQRVDPES
jgi:succinyl-diaminopimelate desuccinylase